MTFSAIADEPKECRMVTKVGQEELIAQYSVPTFTKIVKRDNLEVQECDTTDVTNIGDGNKLEKESIHSTLSCINLETDRSFQEQSVSEVRDLIIFDYDDTILPTYSLATTYKSLLNGKISPELAKELDKYSDAVLENLQKAVQVATVIIVTNASTEWLTQSCERYIPRIGSFLMEHKIRIISARNRFGSSLLSQKHWKYFIFIDLIEEHFIRQLKTYEPFTVLSIGDGIEEREACMKLASIFTNKNWVFKNLKFLSQPTFGCLHQQHILLKRSFQSLIDMKNTVDLCILYDKKRSGQQNSLLN
ncbi:HAD-like superfamily [Babesia duncani]|uniref:HAD-like superfamily n=1 Tax=Babesia duncani TaxID=323732 RepID=A0AAD9PJW4_9APIC|nr:HAD-like superfamily [Babesia duncani]